MANITQKLKNLFSPQKKEYVLFRSKEELTPARIRKAYPNLTNVQMRNIWRAYK